MRVQAGLGHHGLGRGAQLQAVSGGRGGQHRCGHKMLSRIISRCHHRRAALHPLPRVRLRPVSPGPRPPRAQHRRGAAGPRALCALCAGHAAGHARQHVRALLPLAGGRGGGAQHRARVRLRAEGGAVSAAQPRHRGCVQVSLAISITYLLHQIINTNATSNTLSAQRHWLRPVPAPLLLLHLGLGLPPQQPPGRGLALLQVSNTPCRCLNAKYRSGTTTAARASSWPTCAR